MCHGVSSFPTMLRCGILLLTLGAVLAVEPQYIDEQTQTSDGDQNQNEESALALSETCYYGSPTFLCLLRCNQQGLRPYCNEHLELCICVAPEEAEGQYEGNEMVEGHPEASQGAVSAGAGNSEEDQEEGSKLHMIFYIFDLNSLFGDANDTAANATEVSPTSPEILPEDVNPKMETLNFKGWASTHVLAMIIVALLCVLILVELAACLKKQKSKHKEANLFTKTLGVTNKP